jgi:hypothetical protein
MGPFPFSVSYTRRAGFAPVDLSEVFATVTEAFTPAVEDLGKTLSADIAP